MCSSYDGPLKQHIMVCTSLHLDLVFNKEENAITMVSHQYTNYIISIKKFYHMVH